MVTMRLGRLPLERGFALSVAISGLACGDPEPRPQWVVVLDTDAPLTGQLAGGQADVADAAIDTLRIDVLRATGSRIETREIVAPDPRDWPVSFGVVTDEDPGLQVRIRAFRGREAAVDADGLVAPPPRRTIDRLVRFEGTPDGREEVGIRLALACLNRPPSFAAPATTCADANQLRVAPSEGRVPSPTSGSAGGSELLASRPCTGAPPAGIDAVCIPGGFTVIGDERLAGIDDLFVVSPVPSFPARVSPFWLDRDEVTVGEVRALYAAGVLFAAEPGLPDVTEPGLEGCTWRGRDDAENDARPVNCVGNDTAAAVCAARGGHLPTEVAWEHAARGRGAGLIYPWGDAEDCCGAVFERSDGFCGARLGPEPGGPRPRPEGCPFADVSRDGVRDLGGNVLEITAGPSDPYDASCWPALGVPTDPQCVGGRQDQVARGGSWRTGLAVGRVTHRKRLIPADDAGFRCAYDDGPEGRSP